MNTFLNSIIIYKIEIKSEKRIIEIKAASKPHKISKFLCDLDFRGLFPINCGKNISFYPLTQILYQIHSSTICLHAR